MGDEGGIAALPALMGDPEPVGDDQIDAAGEERQARRILVGEAQRGQAEAVACVYASWFDIARCGERDGWVALAGARKS